MRRVRLYNEGGYGLTLRKGYTFPVEVQAEPYLSPRTGALLGYDVPATELQRVFYSADGSPDTLYFSFLSKECKEVIRCEPSR